MDAEKIIPFYKEEEKHDTSDLATKSDINRLEKLLRSRIIVEETVSYIQSESNKKLITPTEKLYNLSKYEKMRALILLISGILSGVFVTLVLINIDNYVQTLFYLTLTLSSLGATFSSFWALMKGKKYDKRFDNNNN